MKFKEMSKEEVLVVRARSEKYAKLIRMLTGFTDSNAEAVEVEGWEEQYANLHSAAESMRSCARKHHLSVKVCERKNRLFLFRKEALDD